jgi:LysM repeat protein
MSKEVIFAAILAVGCLILVGVAFIAPHKPKPEPETTKTETPTETVPPAPDLLTGDGTTGSIAQNTTSGFGTTGSFTTAGGTTGFTGTGSTTGGFTGAAGTTGAFTGSAGTTGGFTGSPAATGGFTGATTGSAFTTGGSTGTFTTGGSFTGGTTFTGGSSTGGFSGTSGSSTGGSTAFTTSSEKTHVIAKNETLAEISQKYFGTAKNWKKIVEANPGLDPRSMKVGQKITIPALSTSAAPAEIPTVSGDHTYTVRAGDSYYTIAKKELGSASRWKEIERLNGISPEDLHVGQVIKLPAASSPTSSSTSGTGGTSDSPVSGKVHLVASGETLSDISKTYFGTTTRWKDIVKANPGVNPETLKVGQKIVIPESANTDGATTGSTSSSSSAGEYVVKPRDTLQSIAEHELGNRNAWKKIVDANPGVDPRNLRVGQKLKIPGKASTGTSPAQDDTRPSGSTTFGGTGFSATTGGTTGFGTTGTTGSFSATTGGFSGTTGGFSGGSTTGAFTAGGTTGGSTAPRPFTASGTTSGATTAGSTAPGGTTPDRITP